MHKRKNKAICVYTAMKKLKKKENKSLTDGINSTFIVELGSNSKSCDHQHLVRPFEVVEIHRIVVEVVEDHMIVVQLEMIDQKKRHYHQMVEMMVVEDQMIVVLVVVVEYKLVVELELRSLVVELKLVEEQIRDMAVDMIEQQGMVAELACFVA